MKPDDKREVVLANGRLRVSLSVKYISNLTTGWAASFLDWAGFGSFITSSNSMRCHTPRPEKAGQNWNQ